MNSHLATTVEIRNHNKHCLGTEFCINQTKLKCKGKGQINTILQRCDKQENQIEQQPPHSLYLPFNPHPVPIEHENSCQNCSRMSTS